MSKFLNFGIQVGLFMGAIHLLFIILEWAREKWNPGYRMTHLTNRGFLKLASVWTLGIGLVICLITK